MCATQKELQHLGDPCEKLGLRHFVARFDCDTYIVFGLQEEIFKESEQNKSHTRELASGIECLCVCCWRLTP